MEISENTGDRELLGLVIGGNIDIIKDYIDDQDRAAFCLEDNTTFHDNMKVCSLCFSLVNEGNGDEDTNASTQNEGRKEKVVLSLYYIECCRLTFSASIIID